MADPDEARKHADRYLAKRRAGLAALISAIEKIKGGAMAEKREYRVVDKDGAVVWNGYEPQSQRKAIEQRDFEDEYWQGAHGFHRVEVREVGPWRQLREDAEIDQEQGDGK